MDDDRPVNRRGFFREALRRMLSSAEQAAGPLVDAMKEFERQVSREQAAPTLRLRIARGGALPTRLWLRPPGALPEEQFRQTCSRCARCVEVCPVRCIRIDPAGGEGDGLPYIDADTSPCIVCESLACMNTCPSGALRPVPLVEIDMGTAVWDSSTCIRACGEECRICVEKCPMGSPALDVSPDGKEIVVNPLHCVGCGMCQHVCPTRPRSMCVVPAAARGR